MGSIQSTKAPKGYSKVKFERFFKENGRFSPNVDKNGATAPRAGLKDPHEGPFVANRLPEAQSLYLNAEESRGRESENEH